MNSRPADAPPKTAMTRRPDWPLQLEAWRTLLADCRQKPTRKRVHILRVATLRLQAQVRYWTDRHDAEHPASQPAMRWNRLAKSLRRSLGTVRALDVHLVNLGKVRAMLTSASGYQPRSCRASLRQLEALEIRFKRNRKKAAKDLIEMLASRQDRLQRATTEIAAAQALQRSLVPAIGFAGLSQMLSTLIARFPHLDANSLHDFRKQLKGIRYLAEVGASGARARQLAAAVKSMQGAVGAWHDWEELAAEAKRVFGNGDLTDLLNSLRDESLLRALDLCKETTQQVLPVAPVDMPGFPPRKPVRRAELSALPNQLISA